MNGVMSRFLRAERSVLKLPGVQRAAALGGLLHTFLAAEKYACGGNAGLEISFYTNMKHKPEEISPFSHLLTQMTASPDGGRRWCGVEI